MEEENLLVSVGILSKRSHLIYLIAVSVNTLLSLCYFYLLLLLDLVSGRTGAELRGGEAPRRLGGEDPRSLLDS